MPNSVCGFFELFFIPAVIETITKETNCYAAKKLFGKTLSTHSIWHHWTDATTVELRAYLRIILRMALHDSGHKIFFQSILLNESH